MLRRVKESSRAWDRRIGLKAGWPALIGKKKRSKNRSLNLQEKLDSLQPSERLPIRIDKKGDTWRAIKTNQKYFPHLIGVLVGKIMEIFHKSWAKDTYKDLKNGLNIQFMLTKGEEENLDIPHARLTVPADITKEAWNKCVNLFNFANYRAQSTLTRIDETTIANEVLGLKRGYRRGVGPKLNMKRFSGHIVTRTGGTTMRNVLHAQCCLDCSSDALAPCIASAILTSNPSPTSLALRG
ncbi:hypothetical protein TorRG33x02_178860 [Trema orientale]|uniref:Uncharacterized protein n=1 Tax=Trema orientale TaxID=63057 RepID=A0A2P5ELA5_TREOI|nr:hypothetical protein TorRG33x02_178860 [Trema orientale]